MPQQPMPNHIGCAYQDAADGMRFLQLQQWAATAFALVIYTAIFVISAHYFSRTDFARNWLGLLVILTFVVHWYIVSQFQRQIDVLNRRLIWIYQTYFNQGERLDLQLEPRSPWWSQSGAFIGLLAVSLIAALLTAIYLWSVR
jgi:hypothetical protein